VQLEQHSQRALVRVGAWERGSVGTGVPRYPTQEMRKRGNGHRRLRLAMHSSSPPALDRQFAYARMPEPNHTPARPCAVF
jgi:hypothetical protein